MQLHREPAELNTDSPDLATALRQALVAAIGKQRLAGLVDPPARNQPTSARAAGRHPGKHHSRLHTASHAAVYAAVALHLLHRRTRRGQ